MSSIDRPVPIPDADSAAYWEGLRENVLRIQRCSACGHAQLYFRAMCRNCWSRELEIVTASGRGTIYSFSVIHQTGNPVLNRETPYALAIVELEEGPRVLSRIEGDPNAVAIGDPVRATFHEVGEFKLLYFRRE